MLPCAPSLRRTCVHPHTRTRAIAALGRISKVDAAAAVALETCIAQRTYYAPFAYVSEVKRLAFNIACNPALAALSAERLVAMSDDELAAGTAVERVKREETVRAQVLADMLVERYENVKRHAEGSNMLRCRHCHSTDIHMVQKQVRGADESMTIFAACLSCRAKWRFS